MRFTISRVRALLDRLGREHHAQGLWVVPAPRLYILTDERGRTVASR